MRRRKKAAVVTICQPHTGATVNVYESWWGKTPTSTRACRLMAALRCSLRQVWVRRECIRLLAELRVDINACNTDSYSPLLISAKNDHTACTRQLIELNADVCKYNHRGISPLWLAVENGQCEDVRLLVERGADVNACAGADGWWPLQWAVFRGDAACVRMLLTDCNADVTACHPIGSPLHLAARANRPECLLLY